MNVIEFTKAALSIYPKINEICNDIHVDFTEDTPTNYGLSSSGDEKISEDICGNQIRQHNFVLYAVYQSQSDYDRLNNSGTLLELAYWLDRYGSGRSITANINGKLCKGRVKKIICSNGMLYAIPEENMNGGVQYQLQISVQYKIESGEF